MPHHSKVWPVAPVDGVDSLTAAEAIALDNGQFTAIDGDAGGTWAPLSLIEIGGSGLQVDLFYARPRVITSGYTLDSSGSDVVLACDTTSAPGGINVALTAATTVGRVLMFKHVAGVNTLGIVPNGTDTIEGLNATYALNQIGSAVILVCTASGAWTIFGKA